MIVAATFAGTDVVAIANVAVFAPAATVTLAGTTAAALLLARATTAPPVGATASKVTVPVEPLILPTTLVGVTERAVKFAADAEGDASNSETRSHALRAIQCSLNSCRLVISVRVRATR